MQTDDNTFPGDRCEPEWVVLNHLLSYCAKSLPMALSENNGESASFSPATHRCQRNNCIFGAKRS